MCDFLLLNKDSWMESLTPEQLADYQARYPKTWTSKYNSRQKKYDIIVCRPDGFFKDHQHGDGEFLIIHVPGLSVEEGEQLSKSVMAFAGLDENGDPKFTLQYKFRGRLKFANLTTAIKNKLNSDHVYTVNLVQWNNFKTNYIEVKV